MKNAKAIKALEDQRTIIVKKNQKEYATRGNTQECQRLWQEICKIDDQIKAEKQKEDKAMTKLEKILQKERERLIAARDKEKAAHGNRTDRHKELTKKIHDLDREIKMAQKCKYAS